MSEIIAKVVQNKSRFNAIDSDGNIVKGISAVMRKKAFNSNKALQRNWQDGSSVLENG